MKSRIWKDERWPDYAIGPSTIDEIEIPDDLFDRWQRVNAAYDAVQKELEEFYEKGRR